MRFNLLLEALGVIGGVTASQPYTARSSAFANFARAVKLPFATQQREMWILSALSNSAEEGVKQ
jgi:hypothetical protein